MIDSPHHFPAIDAAPAETDRAVLVVNFPTAFDNTEYIQYLLGGSVAVSSPAVLITGTISAKMGGDFIIKVSQIS